MICKMVLLCLLAGLQSSQAQSATTYALTGDIEGMASSMSISVVILEGFGCMLEPGTEWLQPPQGDASEQVSGVEADGKGVLLDGAL